jgi:hypothetical protein
MWEIKELVYFIENLSINGVEAISLGGGEPLEYLGVFDVMTQTKGMLFRSMTTNGILLDKDDNFEKLIKSSPDKVHISIHFPENRNEVKRVLRQVWDISSRDIIAGVNLLIRRDNVFEARMASDFLKMEGLSDGQIVYLPMRMKNPVSEESVKFVANKDLFQSISCLKQCGKSQRFCSISWDKKVAWCSYTTSKSTLSTLDYKNLQQELNNLNLNYCG